MLAIEATYNWYYFVDLAQEYAKEVFSAKSVSRVLRSYTVRRYHVHETSLQKAVRAASNKAGITKRVFCHTLRYSFATYLFESGVNIRVLQELLDQKDVSTT